MFTTEGRTILAKKNLPGIRDAHRTMAVDPTNKHKNKVINIIKTFKVDAGIGNINYKRL